MTSKKNSIHTNSYSKIIFFSLLIIFSSTFISCDSNNGLNQVLPSVPLTDVRISLDDPKYFDLQIDGQAVFVNEHAGRKVGYREHGIIVIRTFENVYKAWDATSTYDFNATLSIKGAFAICPESGIEYELYYGTPHKTSSDDSENLKGTSSLQEYYCRKISGNKLRITDKQY